MFCEKENGDYTLDAKSVNSQLQKELGEICFKSIRITSG